MTYQDNLAIIMDSTLISRIISIDITYPQHNQSSDASLIDHVILNLPTITITT